MAQVCTQCVHLPASLKYTENINGRQSIMYLCNNCAEDLDVNVTDPYKLLFPKSSEQTNSNFFNPFEGTPQMNQQQPMPETQGVQQPQTQQAQPNNSKTPTLDKYSRDLTEIAKKGSMDPIIGREDEVQRVIQILSRRTKNNPVLIGEPGVGKTAIAEGLAQNITKKNVPSSLRDKRVLSLDLSALLAGTKYRGEFEERFNAILEEIQKEKRNIILFIDELHTLVGAGAVEGQLDASNMIKPALARGELQTIGATTLNEYKKYIEKDAALERRFQPVVVDEPTEEEAFFILKGLKEKYEKHHEVEITEGALASAVELSSRYINDRFLPDKAIDLIDESSAKVHLSNLNQKDDLKKNDDKLKNLNEELRVAVDVQDFKKASTLKKDISKLKKENKKSTNSPKVTEDDVRELVSSWTGIPVQHMTKKEKKRYLDLEKTLSKDVVGQKEAVLAVSEAIKRGKAGLAHPKRPMASFIFMGPTGVGKTHLAKTLAKKLFDDEDAMVRIDMSEYMEKHSVSKLIGSPPGYIGFEDGGQLTEKIRRKPFSVILLDEIEKAHPEVFNVLLQILEDGRLTDAKGRIVNFKNTIIIATSNIDESMLQQIFRPEFINRLDELITFNKLSKKDVRIIVDLLLDDTLALLKMQDIELEVSVKVKDKLAKDGYCEKFGARPLRREIQKQIENPLSHKILEGKFKSKDKVTVDVKNGKLLFAKK